MSDLLSGLESLGLGDLSGLDIYNQPEQKEAVAEKTKTEEVVVKEEDILYDKRYDCPVCGKSFKNKAVRSGKTKLISIETDLRPRYEYIDTVKYDVVVCYNCGYASLNRFFSFMTHTHSKIIKESICANFVNNFDLGPVYSYDESIKRHKLALLNCVMKRAKNSEKAYTCLKLAWLLRGKAETLDPATENFAEVIRTIKSEEESFVEKAYEGFSVAFTTEQFPMCGMDAMTVQYLVADLARQLGKYDEAMKLVTTVILSKGVNERIKNKARDLKDMIREEVKSLGGR